jgi:hypothetical protein
MLTGANDIEINNIQELKLKSHPVPRKNTIRRECFEISDIKEAETEGALI